MALQIFVEDELAEPYEVLAQRALGLPKTRDRRRVQASRVEVRRLCSRDGLLELFKRSVAAGYDCVMFILDEEALPNSPERRTQLKHFRQGFEELCSYLDRLPKKDPLRRARAIRIVCRRCLEGWLLADPQAVVDTVRGGRGLKYDPKGHDTEKLTPKQAIGELQHHIRMVEHELGRRRLRLRTARHVKALGREIAQQLDPKRARPNNASLAYFYDMVDCSKSGCERPFPERS